MMLRFVVLPVVIAAFVLTTACSQPTAASNNTVAQPAIAADGTQQVTFNVGNSMNFEPKNIALKAGQPVKVTLHNSGFIEHDFTLSSGAATPVTIATNGGQTADATFSIDRPGTYTFICSVSGHESAGMRGTLAVE